MTNDDIVTRLTRMESRLVRLMLWVGLDPYTAHKGEMLDEIEDIIESRLGRPGQHVGAADPGTDWDELERPTCQRRSRVGVVSVDAVPATPDRSPSKFSGALYRAADQHC